MHKLKSMYYKVVEYNGTVFSKSNSFVPGASLLMSFIVVFLFNSLSNPH